MDQDIPPKPDDALLKGALESREFPFRRCSLALLIDIHGRFFGQMRDEKTDIAMPGRIGFFGGGVEHDETPIEAAEREILEEIGIEFAPEDFEPLDTYFSWRPLTHEWEIVCPYVLVNVDSEHMQVFEGQGAIEITDTDDPLLAPTIVPALEQAYDLYKNA